VRRKIEGQLRKLPSPVIDEDPGWTEEDFARARGPESLPPELLAAFPKTRVRRR
jgi:hypothetical protein